LYCVFVAQLRADLEKARDELEQKQRKHETEIDVRDKQIYQLKALMAHFKKVCTLPKFIEDDWKFYFTHRSFQSNGQQSSKLKKRLLLKR